MRLSKWILTCGVLTSTLSLANEVDLTGLTPLPPNSLSELRGGYQVTDDYIINIG